MALDGGGWLGEFGINQQGKFGFTAKLNQDVINNSSGHINDQLGNGGNKA